MCHIITGLHVGGAELVLYNLINATRNQNVENSVICLLPEGPVADKIRALGVPVHCLNMRFGPGILGGIRGLRALVRSIQPDVISAWMYHSNFMSLFAGKTPKVWNIRNALSGTRMKRATTALMNYCARRSNRAAKIIFNSTLSMREHVAAGYSEQKCIVVPNGFDLARFRPDPEERAAIRREFNIGEDKFLFGRLSRYHEDKDFPTLINACALVAAEVPEALFILCGDQLDGENQELVALVRAAGLEKSMILAGRVESSKAIPGFDVMVSSSKTEAFPNVIGEAMACGVPCVATDVGDTKEILRDAGLVCPPEDPKALAIEMIKMARLSVSERGALADRGMQIVMNDYQLPMMAGRFIEIYRSAAKI